MKKKFDIKYRPQIESGEYKVVTDYGESVEVVKWDCKGKYPILAVIDDGDTHDSCFYDEKGVSYSGNESICVLTNEPELTEFEEAIQGLMNGVNNGFTFNIKEEAGILLDIARKEILKDMPKWKPAARAYLGDKLPRIDHSLNRLVVGGEKYGYYLNIDDLDKLPKEE